MRTRLSLVAAAWMLAAAVSQAQPASQPIPAPVTFQEPSTPIPFPSQAPPTPIAPTPIYTDPGPASPPLLTIMRERDPWDSSRIWLRTDFLLWWVKNSPVPVPLVTAGNPNDASPGAIGQPGTHVLFGNSDINYGVASGIRVDLGWWADTGKNIGFELSFFGLERRSRDSSFSSDDNGNPLLAVPVNSNTPGFNQQTASPVSSPGVFAGSVDVSSSMQFWGTEFNAVFRLLGDPGRRYEWTILAGFRYADLQENLNLNAFSADFGSPTTVTVFNDNFNTRNQFYGGQIGSRFFWQGTRLSFDMTGKIAFGATHEVVDIQGFSSAFGPNANPSGSFPGGIFTQPTNIGRHSSNRFSILPSLELKLGYQLTQHARIFMGYDFLYWNQVVRPGSQIDRTINASQSPILNGTSTLVGPASPSPLFNRTDFWAQGINFGVELKF